MRRFNVMSWTPVLVEVMQRYPKIKDINAAFASGRFYSTHRATMKCHRDCTQASS